MRDKRRGSVEVEVEFAPISWWRRWDDYCGMPASGSNCHTLFKPPSIQSTNTNNYSRNHHIFPVALVLGFIPIDTTLFTQCYHTLSTGITFSLPRNSHRKRIIPLDMKSFASLLVSRAPVLGCSQVAVSPPT